MRWTKHLTMAHADKALAAILEEFGAEGYGVYWLMIEDIAAPMEAGKMEPIGIHSVVKWSQICNCSARRWRSIVTRMAEKTLIVVQSIDDRIQIEVPNIVKYKDEYSKKSGQTTEQEREQKQKESKDKTDILSAPTVAEMKLSIVSSVKTPADEVVDWFNGEFWPAWVKAANDSKGAALKVAKAKAKTLAVRLEIIAGSQAQSTARLSHDPQFRSHCSTWLNQERWRDCAVEPQPQVSNGLFSQANGKLHDPSNTEYKD